MLRRFFRTSSSGLLLFQRLVLGLVMFPHGAQKLFGWFGGYGFSGTMRFFEGLGVPSALAVLGILAESIGAIGLVLGAGTRLAALGVTANMIGAILLVHAPHGFFMNWSGQASGEGFEFHLLALALSLPLIVLGAGRASVDAAIAHRLDREAPTERGE